MTRFELSGITWLGFGRGAFCSRRFKTGHELAVGGQRGDWHWELWHYAGQRAPRTVQARGNANTKIDAMLAATHALAEALQLSTGR